MRYVEAMRKIFETMENLPHEIKKIRFIYSWHGITLLFNEDSNDVNSNFMSISEKDSNRLCEVSKVIEEIDAIEFDHINDSFTVLFHDGSEHTCFGSEFRYTGLGKGRN